MQIRKIMSGVLKFVYAIILFLFLFLVAREVGGLETIECETDGDCPRSMIKMWNKNYRHKCIDGKCEWIKKLP
ncbi:putative Late nodulin [Medicago truncatula]|uniref:Nodule Cysteine-Rich (NCR) secreted peptide n=1 Tax=Medicago truncatula TaxID=3880 RepID=A7KHA3_MEDTR|nr:nodule-specific cysteine-rich peptide 146 [Medicago truncatula]AES98847.1 Nodule Cysteine-Rich (NCR) secreted peptide [Medicago truncatula]RHN56653.1 putative Late nodulin [Medicago truncatula]